MSQDNSWVMVPRVPTPEMVCNGAMGHTSPRGAGHIWKAMLAAAPAPAAERQDGYTIKTESGELPCSLAVSAEWEKNEEYIAELEAKLAAKDASPAPAPAVSDARYADLSDAVIDRMLVAFHFGQTNFHHVQWTRDQRRSMRAAIAARAEVSP